MKFKNERQKLIKELIQNNKVKTQTELVAALQSDGFEVTQATVSRDIKEMGLVRDNLGYKSSEEKALEEVFQWVKSLNSSGNIVIVLSEAGSAQTIALAIDKANIDGVIGSVAGDDTIFLATQESKTKKVFNKLNDLKERTA